MKKRNQWDIHVASALGRLLLTVVIAACGSDGGGDENENDGVFVPDEPAEGVESGCGSVRMTTYGSSDRRWCGFDRNSPVLPEFVQAGMTVAIAEPYNGSSYGGDPGEACGECWELTTTFGSTLVMVHDLCPIEGNPICAGGHFHFDVSNEVAAVVDGGGWLGEGAVRRVPCPVSGNIYVYITARNEWGYMQIAFFNQRLPIRKVEYRAADGETWMPMERCLARWCLDGDMETFSDGGPGGIFRLTSATGDVVEATEVLTYAVTEGSDFDIGAQFAEVEAEGEPCEFTPPGDVYDEAWGGIEGVRWEPNTWGNTTLSETGDNCADGSASCVRLDNFEESGLHVTYRHIFPADTFTTLTIQLRAAEGAGTVDVTPRGEESRCSVPTTITVDDTWRGVDIDLASVCPDTADLHGLTINFPSGPMDLMVDEIQFD